MIARYLRTLAPPLVLLLLSAIFVHVASVYSLGAMLVTLGAYLIAPAWGAWLLVVRERISPWAAAYCGPALIFIDVFLFGYLPSLALGRLSALEQHASDRLHMSPEVMVLVGMLIGYILLFPIVLGIAGLGAYIGVRDLRRSDQGGST
jgi:hypothetical protein